MGHARRRSVAALAALLVLATTLSLSACSSSDRTIEHTLGQTTVSGTPMRVVVLDAGELDAVVALGITPVGVALTDEARELPEYVRNALGPVASQIRLVGTVRTPDLTAVADLEPDLILTSTRHSGLYPRLSDIAPTVIGSADGNGWKEDFVRAGDALNRRGDADQVLLAYEERAAEIAVLYGEPGRLTVSALLVGDQLRLCDRGSFLGTVLDDVGFSRPRAEEGDAGMRALALPALRGVAGEAMFYGVSADGKDLLRAASQSQTWLGLPSVSSSRAIAVPEDIWFQADGPVGARLVLDDLEVYRDRLLDS